MYAMRAAARRLRAAAIIAFASDTRQPMLRHADVSRYESAMLMPAPHILLAPRDAQPRAMMRDASAFIYTLMPPCRCAPLPLRCPPAAELMPLPPPRLFSPPRLATYFAATPFSIAPPFAFLRFAAASRAAAMRRLRHFRCHIVLFSAILPCPPFRLPF